LISETTDARQYTAQIKSSIHQKSTQHTNTHLYIHNHGQLSYKPAVMLL